MYARFLNNYPLVAPAGIFCGATFLLFPVVGVYAPIIALVLAAKLTECW